MRLIPIITSILMVTLSSTARGDETYYVYESDPFGARLPFARPQAVIEVDRSEGRIIVYESTPFGHSSIFKSPSHIIEPDSARSPFKSFGFDDGNTNCDDNDLH